MSLWFIILEISVLLLFVGVLAVFVIWLVTEVYPKIIIYENEKKFWDGSKYANFPSLANSPSVYLSVIVPSYNEEKRLPPMLDECLGYLDSLKSSYELIIVDDGSTDKTTQVSLKYSEKYGCDKVRVLTLENNRGKGGAVRLGMLYGRGEVLLFADADGATKFSDFAKVSHGLHKLCKDKSSISESLAISCGSRAHLEEESIATRSYFRTLLMYGFHTLVWFFTVQEIKDTQCGFKLFTRAAARVIFGSLHVERWAFDVEMLYIAQTLNIPVCEVPVTWHEIEGSKIMPVITWIQMGIDLVLIWLRYKIGAWKIMGKLSL